MSFCKKTCLIGGSPLRTSRISPCFCVTSLDLDFVEEEETTILVRVGGLDASSVILSNV